MKDKSLKLFFGLLLMVVFLFVISMMAVYSSSFIAGIRRFNSEHYFIKRQLISYIVGFISFCVFCVIDYKIYEKYRKQIFLLGVLILIIVLIPHVGVMTNGARRWLRFGPINAQPAEFSKILFILSFAGFLEFWRKKEIKGSIIFYPSLVMVGIYIALILKEKDMGTAVHLFVIALFMMYLANVKLTNLIFATGFAALISIPLIINNQHRITRIYAYFNGIMQEGVGGGYQVRQSVIGIGNGGFFGLGYSNGRQKYFYLPEIHTDFIFSVICEEGGFFAFAIVMMIYIVIMIIGIKVVQQTKDFYGKYVAIGVTTCITAQALINMFVASGLVPAKGIPLPLVSYGGSSVVAMMIMLGILANIMLSDK